MAVEAAAKGARLCVPRTIWWLNRTHTVGLRVHYFLTRMIRVFYIMYPVRNARRPIRRDVQNLQYHFNFNFNFNDVDLRAPKS